MKRISVPSLGADRLSGCYLAVVLIIIFGATEPNLFLSMATLHSVASEYAITAMLGVAILVPLTANTFDLSLGATVNLSAILSAALQSEHHWGMGVSIATAIGVSLVIGIVNGFIVVKLHVNSFIATLGTSSVIMAVQEIFTNELQPQAPSSAAWGDIAQTQIFGFQIVFLYLIVMALIIWWALAHTPAGRYLYAIGGNSEAARLTGIRVDKWVWLSLVTSAFLSGVVGILYASLNGPSLTFGSALLLPAFAAAFLGSTQFQPGRFNVWGTVLAVYVLAIGVKGLQLMTGAEWLNDMFNGAALIVAVSFAIWRQHKAPRKSASLVPHQPDGDPGSQSQGQPIVRETSS